MTRFVGNIKFTIGAGASVSNVLSGVLRDAYQFTVFPPAGLAENCQLQIYTGSTWAFYDATNFTAGVDNYKTYDGKSVQYRISTRSGTVAAQRDFEVMKRVAGMGAG